MKLRKFYCGLAFIVFVASACGESTKKNGTGDEEDADTSSDDDGGTGDVSDDGGQDDPDSGGSSRRTDGGGSEGLDIDICGNGTVEGVEECDDGNFDQKDGCTTLCTFSCVEDADCNDMNDCNGVEACDEDSHACYEEEGSLDDGDECGEEGENKSCWQRVCVFNICGDGKQTENEACDDGNLDPDDGCTPDCEYSCEEDSDCSGQDECLGDRVCEDHMCVGGSELDDKTECEIKDERTKKFCGDDKVDKDGWCMAGVCTCTDCGDGVVSGIEECDDGPDNGTEKSKNNCSVNCRVVKCQNGSVEGDEECDDGNDNRLDGCDPDCKFEFAQRYTSLKFLKGVDIPPFCAHQDNRFPDAFAEEVRIMGVMPLNILDIVNEQMSARMASGDSAFVLHFMNSDDISMRTADEEITVGIYEGFPYSDPEDKIDSPFIINADQVDPDTRLPVEYHSFVAEQKGGGAIITKEPQPVEMMSVSGGTFVMQDFMMQLVFDLNTLSVPSDEQIVSRDTIKVSEDLRAPEKAGYDPQGLICGAMDSGASDQPIMDASFEDMGRGGFGPMASFCCKNSGPNPKTKYRACPADEDFVLGEDCDSVSQLIEEGCTVCIEMTDMSNISAVLDEGSNCALMDDNPDQCFKIINGIEYDVDTDGDNVNDHWSALFGFSTERTRIYDVALR